LNETSYLVLLYGRHDLNSDFTGEFRFALSEVTGFYGAYTSAITTSQQTTASNNFGARLGPQGPAAGVSYNQSPTLATLNELLAQIDNRPGRVDVTAGFPLLDANNFGAYDNGFFRQRGAFGTLYSQFGNDNVSLTAFHVERDPIIAPTFSSTATTGASAAWHREFRPALSGYAALSYLVENLYDSEMVNLGLGLQYSVGSSLGIGLRYDFISRDSDFGASDYIANALTLSLTKRFE
jgi:uncharacterized protein (PEP-CTERM system associated)